MDLAATDAATHVDATALTAASASSCSSISNDQWEFQDQVSSANLASYWGSTFVLSCLAQMHAISEQ